MSASLTDVVPPVRNRRRRLRLFIPVLGLMAVLAAVSQSQAWYQAVLSPTTVLGVHNVTANLTLTGSDFLSLHSAATSSTGFVVQNPTVPSHFGFIDPIFWAVCAFVLAALGSWVCSLLLQLPALVTMAMSIQALMSLRAQVEQPSTWGSYVVTRGAGQQHLWFAITLGTTLLVLATIQTFVAKRQLRQQEREADPKHELPLLAQLAHIAREGLERTAHDLSTRSHDEVVK